MIVPSATLALVMLLAYIPVFVWAFSEARRQWKEVNKHAGERD